MINDPLHSQNTARPWMLVLAAVGCIAAIGFSVFFTISQSRLKTRIEKLTSQKENLILAATTTQGTQTAEEAASVKNSLKTIEDQQIVWSKIIEKIEKTIPQNAETKQSVIELRSYNGSSDGRLFANATTRSDAKEPFIDIANVIRAFATDPAFANVFIPSISKSLTSDGLTVFSFGMNFEYKKQDF